MSKPSPFQSAVYKKFQNDKAVSFRYIGLYLWVVTALIWNIQAGLIPPAVQAAGELGSTNGVGNREWDFFIYLKLSTSDFINFTNILLRPISFLTVKYYFGP